MSDNSIYLPEIWRAHSRSQIEAPRGSVYRQEQSTIFSPSFLHYENRFQAGANFANHWQGHVFRHHPAQALLF